MRDRENRPFLWGILVWEVQDFRWVTRGRDFGFISYEISRAAKQALVRWRVVLYKGETMTPEALREVAFEVANSRTLQQALNAVVVGLARSGQVALARIWLLGPGDNCHGCKQASVCKDRAQCLHLSASEGRSLLANGSTGPGGGGTEWTVT